MGHAYIETVPKRGCRFTANVKLIARGDGAAVVTAETLGAVETFTRTHIVAEEEIDDGELPRSLQGGALALPASTLQHKTNVRRAVILGAIAALAVALLVGSYFYFRRRSTLAYSPT